MSVAKFVWALVGTVALALQTFLNDGTLSTVETLELVSLGIGTLLTYLVPNTPLLATAKTWVAAAGAGLTILIAALPDGISNTEIWQVVIAVLVAAGVYTIPNSNSVTRHPITN